MWLVLCPADDLPALWAHARLRERLGPDVELVTQEALAAALSWNHWLSADEVGVGVRLADGRTIDSRRVRGTLNRIVQCNPLHLTLANAGDREYAEQEFNALFLSALSALPDPVFNRPTPQGLAGAFRHPAEWVWRAADAGLPTEPLILSAESADPSWGWHRPFTPGRTLERALVIGDRVLGAPAPGLEVGCIALAHAVGTGILGVDFEVERGQAWFHGATPLPDLRSGGDDAIAAIAAAFTQGAAEEYDPASSVAAPQLELEEVTS